MHTLNCVSHETISNGKRPENSPKLRAPVAVPELRQLPCVTAAHATATAAGTAGRQQETRRGAAATASRRASRGRGRGTMQARAQTIRMQPSTVATPSDRDRCPPAFLLPHSLSSPEQRRSRRAGSPLYVRSNPRPFLVHRYAELGSKMRRTRTDGRTDGTDPRRNRNVDNYSGRVSAGGARN